MNLLTKFEVRNLSAVGKIFPAQFLSVIETSMMASNLSRLRFWKVDQSRGLKLRFYKQVTKIKGGPIGCTELPLISFEHVFGRISSLTFMTPCGRFNRELMNECFI